jgi:hypothetical protein
MVRVIDIWDEAKKIVGNSSDTFLFRRITDAVELLANKGDFDPLVGSLDICVASRVVTLPPEVETILALNMVGRPAVARDELFQFHLNGPGSCGAAIRYEWMDLAEACTYRELACPGKLYGYCDDEQDENAEVWVYGMNASQNVIRTEVSEGVWRDGWKLPVFQSHQSLPENAPTFARITSVRKPLTVGPIRMTTVDSGTEVLLGVYQANETVPKFRRIQLSTCVPWVRIKFRKRTFTITSRYDLIPLHSAQAVIMMLRALKAYDSPQGFAEGEAYEATATRWLTEEQYTRNPPVAHPIQVLDAGPLADDYDHMQ